MTEHDAFEVRFGAAVHRYVGRVSSDLDPFEFAEGIAAREPRRHGFAATLAHAIAVRPRVWRISLTPGWSQLPALGWLLLLAGLLVAAAVGFTAGARLLSSAVPTTVPSVVPSAPYPVLTGAWRLRSSSTIRAVSGDELWTISYDGLWHFVDGAWQGPLDPPPLDGEAVIRLAVGPDGALWVSGETTVAVFRDGAWSFVWKLPPNSGGMRGLAVAPDGTAWVGRGTAWVGGELVGLRREAARYSARSVTCPHAMSRLAATTDGTIYVGSFWYGDYVGSFWYRDGGGGLARSDGVTCTLVDPLGDGLALEVSDLSAGPAGSLLATVFDEPGKACCREWMVMLRDGRWSTISGPTVKDGIRVVGQAIAPDGHPWRIDDDGSLQRYQGGAWRVVVTKTLGSMALAPDGVLWYGTVSGLERIRADEIGN